MDLCPLGDSDHITMSVIIPAYGNAPCLVSLIDQLQKQRMPIGCNIEILIIDNGLIKSLAQELRDRGDCRYISSGANLMYMNAITMGLRYALGVSVLISNQDVRLIGEDVLIGLLGELRAYSSKGIESILMPCHRDRNGQTYCTGLRRKGLFFICESSGNQVASSSHVKSYKIDYFSGCFFLTHKSTLSMITANIRNWPSMYLEDVAMSLEAARNQIRLFCMKDLSIVHDYQPVYKSPAKSFLYIKSVFYFLRYVFGKHCLQFEAHKLQE